MPSRDKESYSIQAVENALDVLEALSEIDDDVRISQLSEKLAMNKTSVFRLLATFENRGYVEREEQSGKYRLGLSAYEIGQKFLSRMGLLRHAKPLIERLARGCNEAVYVAVRRRKEVLFLDMVDTSQKVKIVSLVGKRFPLETTAAGQVLLAMKMVRVCSLLRELPQISVNLQIFVARAMHWIPVPSVKALPAWPRRSLAAAVSFTAFSALSDPSTAFLKRLSKVRLSVLCSIPAA